MINTCSFLPTHSCSQSWEFLYPSSFIKLYFAFLILFPTVSICASTSLSYTISIYNYLLRSVFTILFPFAIIFSVFQFYLSMPFHSIQFNSVLPVTHGHSLAFNGTCSRPILWNLKLFAVGIFLSIIILAI